MPRRIAPLTSTAVRAFRANFSGLLWLLTASLLRELLVVIQKENLVESIKECFLVEK